MKSLASRFAPAVLGLGLVGCSSEKQAAIIEPQKSTVQQEVQAAESRDPASGRLAESETGLHSKDTPATTDTDSVGYTKDEKAVLNEFPELNISPIDTNAASITKRGLVETLLKLRPLGITTRDDVHTKAPELEPFLEGIATTTELREFSTGVSKKPPALRNTELQWIKANRELLVKSSHPKIKLVASDTFTGKGPKEVEAFRFTYLAIEESKRASDWLKKLDPKSHQTDIDIVEAFNEKSLEIALRGYVKRGKQQYRDRDDANFKSLCKLADTTPRGEVSRKLIEAYMKCLKVDAEKLDLKVEA